MRQVRRLHGRRNRPVPHKAAGLDRLDWTSPPTSGAATLSICTYRPAPWCIPMDGDLDPAVAVMFNPLGAGFAWGDGRHRTATGPDPAVPGFVDSGASAAPLRPRISGAGMVAITGLGRDEHKLALARDMGADIAIKRGRRGNPVERVLAATGGNGVDCGWSTFNITQITCACPR